MGEIKSAVVKFGYGALCDTLEKQANKQGFTLGKDAEKLENYRRYATLLFFGLSLPNSMFDKMLQKLNKLVIDSLIKK